MASRATPSWVTTRGIQRGGRPVTSTNSTPAATTLPITAADRGVTRSSGSSTSRPHRSRRVGEPARGQPTSRFSRDETSWALTGVLGGRMNRYRRWIRVSVRGGIVTGPVDGVESRGFRSM